ncbi:class I SAM-dependent methyltransferase, partial [Acidobacteriota bacterium]
LKGIYRWARMFPNVVFAKKKEAQYLKKVNRMMHRHDMVKHDSEDYFRTRYMTIIDSIFESQELSHNKLKVLDIGCGQGRLSIPLAKKGCQVDALDCVPDALEKAKIYAEEEGVKKDSIEWILGEIPDILDQFESESYDFLLCTEVLMMIPGPEDALNKMCRLLKKNGIFLISLRSRLYYLQQTLLYNDLFKFRIAAEKNNYKEVGDVSSWFDPNRADQILTGLGLTILNHWGIGTLSGIDGDPTSQFCRPVDLKPKERDMVGRVEDDIAQSYYDAGRYIVYSGVKKESFILNNS